MDLENVIDIEVELEDVDDIELDMKIPGPKGDKGDKGDPGSIKFIVVNELPTENIEENVIYMKPSDNPNKENTYNEYIYTNGNWESIGNASVEVNLNEYATKEYVDNLIGDINTELASLTEVK